MVASLLIPTLLLMVLAVLVTRGVERCAPESLPGLAATALVAATLMWFVAALAFAGLYLWQGADVLTAIGAHPGTGLRHFLGLGLKAAVIWAPLVLITVVTAPRRWKTSRW